MRILDCIFGQHDLWLVLLAAGLCLVGSAITMRLFQRLARASAGEQWAWIFLAAMAGGATTWCTHFVAMLAYHPGAAITYEPMLTAASLMVAMLGSALAFTVASLRRPWAPAISGALFAFTVCAMHYSGMAAFMVEAVVEWSPAYIVLSVVAATTLGALAFHRAADRRNQRYAFAQGVGLMVLAIVALHFTGMSALTIIPFAPADGALTGQSAEVLMALAVAGVGLLVVGTGVASYALDDQSRRRAKARLDDLVESSVDGMVVLQDGRITAANAAFSTLVRSPHTALIGQPLSNWLETPETAPEGMLARSNLLVGDAAPIPVEVAIRRQGGEGDSEALTVYAIRDLRGRMAQERRIAHLARNDSLTGLPNRASFLEFLTARSEAPEARLALLALDLDRFKEVNDIYGHAAGDELLIKVSERMRAVLRTGEFIARLGGDEFVAVTPISHRDEALGLGERLRDAIVQPVELEFAEVTVGVSLGVALWPDNARTVTGLINDADLAMYRAKASLTEDICFYEEEMDEAVRDRRRLVQGLREALAQNQFSLNYQVQASASTGELTGYEALLRWRRDDGTLVPPDQFIPLAEESGLILPIGEWVLRRACADAAAWKEPHKVAVNLSPVQLGHIDLPRLVHQVLIDTGLPPHRLELEITETAMIEDIDRTTHVLRQLKALGVGIAMDDFGTGYSSLSTLRAFPFDKIKLDRSFMIDTDGQTQGQEIVRVVLALGESLGIPVLAEGVETAEQLEFLRDQGCQEVQGYFLGRPSAEIQTTLPNNALSLWAVGTRKSKAA